MSRPGLAHLVRDRAAAARHAARADIVATPEDETNAFICAGEDSLIDHGPLAGLMFGVKDNIDVAGYPTTCGSILTSRARAVRDASAVRPFREAGATFMGKTNLGEVALEAFTDNPHFGPVRNPLDLTRSAGGSSGGSGAAVAAGLVDFALGSDSAGSVRIPAAMCGVVGYRPSPWLLGLDGLATPAWSMDGVGLLAPTAADAAWLMDQAGILKGAQLDDGSPLTFRLGALADDSMGLADPAVWSAYRVAVDGLRAGGMDVSDISLPGLELSPPVAAVIAYAEVAAQHRDFIFSRFSDYGVPPRYLVALGQLFSANDYLIAQRMRTLIRARFAEATEEYNAILMPTLPVVPPVYREDPVIPGDDSQLALYSVIRFTALANLVEAPALSLPIGPTSAGLPVGLQIMVGSNEDLLLLKLAQKLEELLIGSVDS